MSSISGFPFLTGPEPLDDPERKFRHLANALPLLVWMARADGYIYWFNQRWYEYTGTTPEQMEGWGWQSVHDPQMLPAVLERYRACLVAGERFEMEFPLRSAKGEYRWFLTRIEPELADDGTVLRWLATNTDVHDLRVAREELMASNERFEAAIQAVGDIVWTNSAEGQMTSEQPGWSAYTGQTQDEYAGFGWAAALHPEDAQPTLEEWNRCVRERRMFVFEHRLRRSDGVYRLFAIRAVPVISEDGEIREWVGVHTDVTEHREREQALRESEARKSAILETALDCIVTVDNQSRIVEFNPAAEQTFGYHAEEVMGKTMPELIIPPRFREAHWKGLARFLETGQGAVIGKRVELVGMRADGGEFPMEAAISAIPGQPPLFTATLRDITSRNAAEADLKRAQQEAEGANRAKTDFLASMSHELRTPLNAIIGYSEMLQEEAEDAGAASLVPDLQRIHGAGKHLLALINGVLDLSKIESGKVDIYLEDFDVAALVEEVTGTIKPLLEKNHNTLAVNVEPGAGVMHADLTKVRQSLFNLLSNAAKFTSDGEIRLDVLTRNNGREEVLMRVQDAGIGMTPEQMERLFEPFQQADPGISRVFGGTGLGLALTRRFCQMQGGEVTAESEFGQGSVFTIVLPRVVATASAGTKEEAESEPRQFEQTRKGTVLVIDDDPTARDLIARLLAKEGFGVELASNGLEGIAKAREHHPTAITLDVMMPQMDGWAVLNALKADPELRDIPVVMLTMIENRTLGYTLGASDYLTKPVEREQLSGVLRKYACGCPPCPVLVIDDDPDARQLFRQLLEREGWSVDEATDGVEGLAKLEQEEPRLIMLDLMMPNMDGFEFMSRLLADARWRQIPVVVLTAKDITELDRERLQGQVEQILQKTAVSLEDVLAEVERVVHKCMPQQSGH